eukprot:3960574-Pleurochrysis_carterae.AAC.1
MPFLLGTMTGNPAGVQSCISRRILYTLPVWCHEKHAQDETALAHACDSGIGSVAEQSASGE